MSETKTVGLTGNSHQRRIQFRELRRKYGADNVKRIVPEGGKNKGSQVEITIAGGQPAGNADEQKPETKA